MQSVVSVTRDRPAASKRPATEIVRTQRISGVCARARVRACVLRAHARGNLNLYHMFLVRTNWVTGWHRVIQTENRKHCGGHNVPAKPADLQLNIWISFYMNHNVV
jgi:hypothetical protein